MLTQQGKKRRNNEDYVYIVDKPEYKLYCLADGMGGHAKGEEASKIAVESFIINFQDQYNKDNNLNVPITIRNAFKYANQQVRKIEFDQGNSPGTTLIVVIYFKGIYHFGSIGDSYLVYYNEYPNIVNKLHEDHWGGLELYLGLDEDDYIYNNMDVGELNIHNNDKVLLCSDGIPIPRLKLEFFGDDLETLFYGANEDIEKKIVEWAEEKTGDDCSIIVI